MQSDKTIQICSKVLIEMNAHLTMHLQRIDSGNRLVTTHCILLLMHNFAILRVKN
jgi:hypothetical protein